MKRLGYFIKSNTKLFIGFILGALIFGSVGAVVAGTVASSEITYTNNGQTTVQGALNDLYDKANTWIDPSYIDFTTLANNTKKTVLASSAGICIKRNNKVSCMMRNNWDVEKDHIQQIFSDVGAYNSSTGLGCTVDSYDVECFASDFRCDVNEDGFVECRDKSDNSYCYVDDAGSADCT